MSKKPYEETVERTARHTCVTAFAATAHILYKLLPRATVKKLNERASLYEGHGFSRAVNGLCLTASAAEVRFLRNPQVCGFPLRFSDALLKPERTRAVWTPEPVPLVHQGSSKTHCHFDSRCSNRPT